MFFITKFLTKKKLQSKGRTAAFFFIHVSTNTYVEGIGPEEEETDHSDCQD